MEYFDRFYLWGIDTKYRMGLYFAAVVFFKGLVNVLLGDRTVDIVILLEMLLACFAFACLESLIFPWGKEWTGKGQGRRIALWAVLANLIFIGCAWGLGWFTGAPVWGGLLLILLLECALVAMWYALWLKEKRDTAILNQGLQRFQEGT
ncbi:hypothetical protein D7V91_14830 [bacterium 1xD42-67]|nr:hypothetical protein D7V91_14830 [bacterium 1xD42-67]